MRLQDNNSSFSIIRWYFNQQLSTGYIVNKIDCHHEKSGSYTRQPIWKGQPRFDDLQYTTISKCVNYKDIKQIDSALDQNSIVRV